MVAFLLLVCRLILRTYFRQLEIVGREQIPAGGKVIFALNHPNGLIDPLFILCYAGRPVSFLAKAPLFRMPVVGYFVRAFQCLPVYRKQDDADPAQNRATIQAAVALLSAGNALALFPEGTSHSDSRLKPLRSGAARIALSAAAHAGGVVHLIPVGLYYSHKHAFRSNALMLLGTPLEVLPTALDADLEPHRDQVNDLTGKLLRRMGQLTLQAESAQEIFLAKSAERIIVAANRDEGLPVPGNMAEKLNFRKRLLEGHAKLEDRAEVNQLVERIRSHQATLNALGLSVDQSYTYRARGVFAYLTRTIATLAVLAAPGVFGLLVHYPTYRLVGWLAFRYARTEFDVLATGKVLAGLLLFPVTWTVIGALFGGFVGAGAGVILALLLPACAYSALLLVESISEVVRHGKALWLSLTRRGFIQQVVSERRAIREEVLALAELLERRSRAPESLDGQDA